MRKTILTVVLCFSGNLLATCPSMDFTGDCVVDFKDFALFAEQWLDAGMPDPVGIVWVSISDHIGVTPPVPFSCQMNKYETTNAQYCQFLNAGLASGDIIVDGNDVRGANGLNLGEDFAGELYYDLVGEGYTFEGVTNGGAAKIHYTGSAFAIDSGFENHPVTYVSWYGATAFCNYYGYRLPTELEWKAIADYDGTYLYGTGATISNAVANYSGSVHLDGTTVVGSVGNPLGYGYGLCDMAGNVWEWTSTVYETSRRVIRGGSWFATAEQCGISYTNLFIDPSASSRNSTLGFRVCR